MSGLVEISQLVSKIRNKERLHFNSHKDALSEISSSWTLTNKETNRKTNRKKQKTNKQTNKQTNKLYDGIQSLTHTEEVFENNLQV